MTVKTLSSDEARNHWRDTLDAAWAGDLVVIERYNKPTAVILGARQWNEMQARLEDLEDGVFALQAELDVVLGKEEMITLDPDELEAMVRDGKAAAVQG